MSELHVTKPSRASMSRLLDLIRQATGPSRDLDHLLFDLVSAGGPFRRYTSDLDSALSLLEEALPGSGWDIGCPARPSGGKAWASVWPWGRSERRQDNHRTGATPVLALLDALVSAAMERFPPDIELSSEIELLAKAPLIGAPAPGEDAS